MLLEFSVKNFRSIKDSQTFSMTPLSKVKEMPNNVINLNHISVLKSSIIYGRNGSGKSNLLNAIKALSVLVNESGNFKLDDGIPFYEPYKFDIETENAPTEFKICFIGKDNIKYEYEIIHDREKILKEHLICFPSKKPTKLFFREYGKQIELGPTLGKGYKNIIDTIYKNQSFLSKVGTNKIDILIQPFTSLTRHLQVHVVHDTSFEKSLVDVFTKIMADPKYSYINKNLNKLMQIADTGINKITIKQNTPSDFKLPEGISVEEKNKILERYKYQVFTSHNYYKNGILQGELDFDFDEESTGTKKLFAYGGFIIEAIEDGDIIVIDELDKSLHPLLTKALINLFNNPKTNPKNAQLIFASHDVSLLSNSTFRRDQVVISEKDSQGVSNFYTIGDINGVRKDVPFEKYYLKGLFGGLPSINEFDFDFTIEENEQI